MERAGDGEGGRGGGDQVHCLDWVHASSCIFLTSHPHPQASIHSLLLNLTPNTIHPPCNSHTVHIPVAHILTSPQAQDPTLHTTHTLPTHPSAAAPQTLFGLSTATWSVPATVRSHHERCRAQRSRVLFVR
jgi:hypothetical protein